MASGIDNAPRSVSKPSITATGCPAHYLIATSIAYAQLCSQIRYTLILGAP